MADMIVVSSLPSNGGKNDRQCGPPSYPCKSIDYAISHLSHEFVSMMYVDNCSLVQGETELSDMTLLSKGSLPSKVNVFSEIPATRNELVVTSECVTISLLKFSFPSPFSSKHSSFILIKSGSLSIQSCSFCASDLPSVSTMPELSMTLIVQNGKHLAISRTNVSGLSFASGKAIIGAFSRTANISFEQLSIENVALQDGSCISIVDPHENSINSQDVCIVDISQCLFSNVSRYGSNVCAISASSKELINLSNCSFKARSLSSTLGSAVLFAFCLNVEIKTCSFVGEHSDPDSREVLNQQNEKNEGLCLWNGSLVWTRNSFVAMKDTVISNSCEGGLSVSGGRMTVEMGMFKDNNPSIRGYPSARRNILCGDSGELMVSSLKGGDGLRDNTSLWVLSDGCTLDGIAAERLSPFFIPILDSVEMELDENKAQLTFVGALFLPCNLQLQLIYARFDEEMIEKYPFEGEGFVNESVLCSDISAAKVRDMSDDTELIVAIMFGEAPNFHSTSEIVLKNASKKRDDSSPTDNMSQSSNEKKSSWTMIVIVMEEAKEKDRRAGGDCE
ncbi:uncharacterized protein MONOS_4264 [Monocercomonoides exilis]|uniref:uncharacterized protein n=1 Tax=Monocercomonoides exilis TaxID=2049356 RepID=UPI00355A0735|nr:hypothetical protein MONOS_4264 [Monocercomonoides exilis]|eukprot:MONOS_4264.1-p1 / transcript=MONOS_4264.1 / gene=MONOS_4264 / organism=Monocercomonoides_exilis_PA203 / gene_product=unspecified product / transcript_product=unspecified product / location=Mono_scaffold00111:46234-47972(+) / protein_length=561 / sequence_SO=supercontig / SO=protein_coding / is_pseudo=false